MKCRLCGSKNLSLIKGTEENYYFCPDCSLIMIDEREIPDRETELNRYREHDNTHDNQGYVEMFEKFIRKVIVSQIEDYPEQIKKVLDFGCGPGPVLADLLREKGLEVELYDPYFYPEQNFYERKYDLITSTEVFEHLQNPSNILETLGNSLKVGGYLAVMTSFHPGPSDFAEWWYKWDPTHITFYNRETCRWIARNFSFDLIYEDGNKYCLLQKV